MWANQLKLHHKPHSDGEKQQKAEMQLLTQLICVSHIYFSTNKNKMHLAGQSASDAVKVLGPEIFRFHACNAFILTDIKN